MGCGIKVYVQFVHRLSSFVISMFRSHMIRINHVIVQVPFRVKECRCGVSLCDRGRVLDAS